MKNSLFIGILIFVATILNLNAQNQINVNIIVQPPYSPYLSDYLIYENRTTIVLSNTRSQDFEIYLKGRVEGDNGVLVQTDENYKPDNSILVPANSSINLSGAELENYFVYENVTVEGLEVNDLYYGDGLPEGNYSICLQAFNFETDLPMSMEAPIGCGNIFIQWVEPPEIILPLCNDNIQNTTPQNVVFSWSLNAGAAPQTQYLLTLTELEEGQDPNDASNALFTPPFFETIVNTTSYVYGFADPQLELGKTYAMRVRSFDPMERTAYKNNGESEVCYFTYGFQTTIPTSRTLPTDVRVLNNDLDDIFVQLNNTSVSGYLNYKFKDQASNPNDEDFNYVNTFDGQVFDQSQNPITDFINNSSDPSQNTSNDWGQFTATTTPNYALLPTNPLGKAKYVNEGTIPMQGTEALEDVTIQLVKYYVYKDGADLEGNTLDYVLNPGAIHMLNRSPIDEGFTPSNSQYSVVGVDGYLQDDGHDFAAFQYKQREVIASTSTKSNGHFQFNFNLSKPLGYLGEAMGISTPGGVRYIQYDINSPPIAIQDWQTIANGGWVYTCLKLEVIHPQFCSPDIDIIVQPGDHIEIPTQVALVNSYQLEMDVKAQAQNALWSGIEDILENVNIKVMRNHNSLNNVKPEILEGEGQQLNSNTNLLFALFKDVVKARSDVGGKAKILHLAKHIDNGPYMVQLLSRNLDEIERTENTTYNYTPTYIEINTVDSINRGKVKGPFNRYFKEPVLKQTFLMKALQPEIKGRLIESSNLDFTGIPYFNVDLLNQYRNEVPVQSNINILGTSFPFPLSSYYYLPNLERPRLRTNPDGRFRIRNLIVNSSDTPGTKTAAGPFRRLKFHRYGYKDVYRGKLDAPPYNLAYGRLLELGEIPMLPLGKVKGKVRGEDGKYIEAYVKVADGAMYRTKQIIGWNNGPDVYTEFLMLAESGQNVPLQIKSLNSEYFDSIYYVNINVAEGQVQDLGTFTLARKKRKVKVYVFDDAGKPIADAKVSIGERVKLSNNLGLANFSFENNSAQYLLKVIPSTGVSIQKWINIPISKTPKTFFIKIESGQQLAAKVIDKDTGDPIQGARAFSLISSLNGHDLIIESISDSNGDFVLKGIPNNQNTISIKVVKEGVNPIYAGETKQFNLVTGINRVDKIFRLKKLGDWALDKIWGFPAVFTSFKMSGDKVIVNGYFKNLPAASGFSASQDLQLDFEGLQLIKNASGEVSPQYNYIQLKKNTLPIKVNNTFSANFSALPQKMGAFYYYPELSLKKITETTGQIIGQVQIKSESFNFANQFDGKLFIGNESDLSSVVVFSSTNNSGSRNNPTGGEFFVFDIKNNQVQDISNFSALRFKGKADRSKSKLIQNKIVLHTELETNIPRCTPADLDLFVNVVLTEDELDFESLADKHVNFKLDDWTINGLKPWTFDSDEELIVLPEVLINTGKGMDARVVNMKLSPTNLSEGNIALEGGLTLGNVVTVKVENGTSAHFDYDDDDDIYRIYLKGARGSSPAYVDDLPGLKQGDKLSFETFSIMSRGSDPISIAQNVKLFKVLDLNINQMTTGLGFVSFAGGASLNLPGEIFQQTEIKYTKVGNEIIHEIKALKGFVELEGNVKFKLKEGQAYQKIDDNSFTSYGEFIIRPNHNIGGNPIVLKGKMNKSANACQFDIIRTGGNELTGTMQQFSLGSGKDYMNIEEGSCSLINNGANYSLLKFIANTDHYEGIGDRVDKDGNAKKGNKFNFEVAGAITANSDKVEVSNIDLSPLGEMGLTFYFDDMSLRGDLRVSQPIPMGFATLSDSHFKVKFDRTGFVFAAQSDISIASFPRPIDGGIILGMGKATEEQIKLATESFKISPENLPTQIKNRNIAGFFVGGELELFDLGPLIIPTPLAGIPAVIEGAAGIGGYFNFGFSNGLDVIMGGYAYANISASLNVGCTFCFGATAYADIVGRYQNSNLTFSSCGTIGAAFSFDCPLLPEASIDVNLKNQIIYDNGLSLSFGLGSCGPSNQSSICGND